MISIKIDTRQLETLARRFLVINERKTVAIRQGVQDSGNKTLTQVRRALKNQTGVKAYRSILSRTRGYSDSDGTFYIRAKAKAIPIDEFKTIVTKRGVVAYSWGLEHDFKRSFMIHQNAKSGIGPVGPPRYMARLGDSRFPVRRLLGPSLAKELGKDQSLDAFMRTTEATLIPSITGRLMKVIGVKL